MNKPTLSTFIGQDPNLASLDYTADVAVHYGHFKKEISRHASTVHPLLGTVIDSGDEKKALAALDKRSNLQRPTPKVVMTEPQDISEEQERYDFELWEYRMKLTHHLKVTDKFKDECEKFYNVVVGQLSQLMLYRLETLPNFVQDVKEPRNLAALFVSLDEVILGDKKDTAPFINSLKVLFAAFTTRQSNKLSLPDYHRDFASRLDLLKPKFKDQHRQFRHLLSPVLLCAPHFAQDKYGKTYEQCTNAEKEQVNLLACNKIEACLFLMLSRNSHGSSNSELLKEKHNQYLGNQDTYPPDMAQAVRQVTDYRPMTFGTVPSSNFSISGNTNTNESKSIACRLCGRAGVKSPDCPNASCKAFYSAKRQDFKAADSSSPSTDSKTSNSKTASAIVQMIDADNEEPLPWIQGMGL